jgi:hypothetical protein
MNDTIKKTHRVVGGLLCVGFFLFASGCATTGGSGSSQSEREIPPEVTDHTVDDRSEDARSRRPRVEVAIDGNVFEPEATASYEDDIRRGAVQCYQSGLRGPGDSHEGSVVWEVIVTRNGYVAGAELMSTALNHDDIQGCVERVISHIRYDVPESGRPLYRIFFRLDFFIETLVPTEPPV